MTDTVFGAHAHRLFNTPLECGLRTLFLLSAAAPAQADLQRLISYDYLLVHSGDVEGGPPSLHPAVPFRGSELLVKRDVIRAGLDLMFARELIEKRMTLHGIFFHESKLTKAFIGLLKTAYANQLASRARWVIDQFGSLPDARADAVVLYLARPALEERASAIDSIATEFAAHAGALRPPLTLALHPGLSLAVDPANGESFGQHRCRLLAEAFLAAPNDNDNTVLAQIAERMARDGIAPTRPYAGGDDPPFPWEA